MWLEKYDEYIIEQYTKQERTLLDISNELHCSYQGIAKRLKKHGIALRVTLKFTMV